MEKSSKVWMKIQDNEMIVKLPIGYVPKGNDRFSKLKRSSSENDLLKENFNGYEIIKLKEQLIIRDKIPPPSLSSETDTEINDLDLPFGDEHVVHPDKPCGLSRSSTNFFEDGFFGINTRSLSETDLVDSPRDNEEPVIDYEKLRTSTEAAKIYDEYNILLLTDEDFSQTEQKFQQRYPAYWNHLTQKFAVYLDPEIVVDEYETQRDFIQTCGNAFEEEDLMGIKGDKEILEFSGGEDILNDFNVSAMFLKENYAPLFALIIEEHNLAKICEEKQKILKNRVQIMKLMEKPEEMLADREAKYSSK